MRDFHRTDFKIWMTYIRSRFIQFCAILKTSWRMYAQRQTIIDLYRARKKPVDIARTLKIDRDAVWRTVRRFEERGDLKDRQKCGRPCTVRTAAERINSCEQRIKRVRERIRRNPLRSIRKMARQEATSPTSMRNIVKRPCLECHQFDRIWSSSQPKQPRWSGSKDPGSCLTKSRTRRSSARLSFFDEKVFTVEQAFNRKTDLIVSKTVKDIPKSLKTVSRRQKSLSVMVGERSRETARALWSSFPKASRWIWKLISTKSFLHFWEQPTAIAVNMLGHSNKTVHRHTPQRRLRRGVLTISLAFGRRICGPHHLLTSTLWTFPYGPFWRVKPVLISTPQSIL